MDFCSSKVVEFAKSSNIAQTKGHTEKTMSNVPEQTTQQQPEDRPTVAKVITCLQQCLELNQFSPILEIGELFAHEELPINAAALPALNLLITCYERDGKAEYAKYFRDRVTALQLADAEQPGQIIVIDDDISDAEDSTQVSMTYAQHMAELQAKKGKYTKQLEQIIKERKGSYDFALSFNCQLKWEATWSTEKTIEVTAKVFLSNVHAVRKILARVLITRGCISLSRYEPLPKQINRIHMEANARDIAAKDALQKLQLLISRLESAAAVRMSTELVQQAARWQVARSDARRLRALTNARKLLLTAEDGYLFGARLYAYGSATTGIALADSDLDISIYLPGINKLREEFTGKETRVNSLRMLQDCAENAGMQDISLIKSARIPVLKYYDADADVDIDVTIANDDSILLSRLLRAYVTEDVCVWQLCMTVKFWAKRREIYGVPAGFFSGMAWAVMVIFFLQHVARPRVCSLYVVQEGSKRENVHEAVITKMPSLFNDGEHCTNAISALRVSKNMKKKNRNQSNAAELLTQFFQFFGDEFDFSSEMISLQLQRRKCHNMKLPKNVAAFIEQPLRFGDNVVSHVDTESLKIILYELQRAGGICRTQGDLQQVFKKRH